MALDGPKTVKMASNGVKRCYSVGQKYLPQASFLSLFGLPTATCTVMSTCETLLPVTVVVRWKLPLQEKFGFKEGRAFFLCKLCEKITDFYRFFFLVSILHFIRWLSTKDGNFFLCFSAPSWAEIVPKSSWVGVVDRQEDGATLAECVRHCRRCTII